MWRYLTRGFQRRLKKSLYCEKSDICGKDLSTTTSVKNQQFFNTRLLPGASQTLYHRLSKHCDDNQHQEEYEQTSNNRPRPVRPTQRPSHHTFLEAFGWSGAIVFGWAISKQLFLHHRTRDSDARSNKKIKYPCLIKLLAKSVKTQPPVSYVLPHTNVANRPKSSKDTEVLLNSEIKAETNVIHEQDTNGLDDEFEAAANELLKTHMKTMGEALNRKGIACLSRSRDTEAIKYFERASELKYPPASFNMGQCCELGIGTEQDFKQAAEWYRKASEQGHATAMYNLGVFYAHGWGGLLADIGTAKTLFARAAKLGQVNAKAALEKESKSDVRLKSTNIQVPFKNESAKKSVHTNSIDVNLFVNNMRIGLGDDVLQKKCGPENTWEVPLNSAVAF